jgi:hypothetical protein
VGRDETVEYFVARTRNLLVAEARARVGHHVLLSIVGIDSRANAHYAGKREQERLVREGRVPWTMVPATQFFDLAQLASGWAEKDGVSQIAPLLVQPIAADGGEVKLVVTWSAMFHVTMAGNVMLPADNVRIAPTTFEQWLAAGGQ